MPERGWSILTIREATAKRLKELAHSRGLTIDELVNELMNPSGSPGWSLCSICGSKVKTKNLHEHILKVHPKPETQTNTID